MAHISRVFTILTTAAAAIALVATSSTSATAESSDDSLHVISSQTVTSVDCLRWSFGIGVKGSPVGWDETYPIHVNASGTFWQ
jgi:hypothetical protein